jgi:hypothetical protein
MVTITIPDKLARRLESIAQQENRSIDDVAASILEKHMPVAPPLAESDDDEEAPPGSLAALIKAADEADIRSDYTDTAERGREILNTEYPKYLARKFGLDDKSETES